MQHGTCIGVRFLDCTYGIGKSCDQPEFSAVDCCLRGWTLRAAQGNLTPKREYVMPATTTTRRSFFVTVFGVIGTLWFAIHALEYLYARYDALEAMLPMPAPFGLPGVFEAMPPWAGIAATAAIWLGLLGSFLLLLGDRASVLILSFTFLATLVGLAWGAIAFFEGAHDIAGVQPLMFLGSQAAMTFGLWLYSRTAKRYHTI